MAPRGSLLLLALLLLASAVPRCPGQHWSHGWYPGGKRDLAPPPGPAGLGPVLSLPPPPRAPLGGRSRCWGLRCAAAERHPPTDPPPGPTDRQTDPPATDRHPPPPPSRGINGAFPFP
ncbi:progonadoliberin-3 [Aquila chrysaetos chrysaetos]|uniref:progonadoliberin-3 n=1 Tax=Aquila chrysaetos chrysaetos TaxID=223781 RepID=UPI0011771BA2|nr:progonadoliberin-3 [Aquila chrysaetos chrysaetos]